MEKLVLRVLIITSASSLSEKHVFINRQLNWSYAMKYCREKYTDLSPITSEVEEQVFKESVGQGQSGWIGLYWDPKNLTWAWSGGDTVTYTNWEEKTWEEALEHCRESHSDLTSLLSKSENLLAQTEIQSTGVTERVWIGLRFLGDDWLWVNGHPLKYKAWPRGGDQDHQCPMWRRCGALTKDGVWENIDCQEKLPFICY
ncbi:snaclec agkisacutacin subunit B-like [Odontesthes bonariensis]|uniref:snaclec agkisacutacin subunit B-like n=1 Tax=Odontesthes bonariensis TaxID=219752 RepID=UPI003F589069